MSGPPDFTYLESGGRFPRDNVRVKYVRADHVDKLINALGDYQALISEILCKRSLGIELDKKMSSDLAASIHQHDEAIATAKGETP